MNTFNLSREFFKWCFENSRKITPSHIAIYFFIIDLNNRLGWKKEIGLPSEHCMETLGIKKHQTFLKYLNELAEFGFIKIVQKSKNQYTSNIISINSAMPKNGKALDKALGIAEVKHEVNQGLDKVSIDKLVNLETSKPRNNKTLYQLAVDFWLEFKVDYIFDGMSGKHLKKLLEKIKELLHKNGSDESDESIIQLFSAMCNNLPAWYKDKDLSVINSKFNEIIEQIKNNKNESSTTKRKSKFNAI